MASFDGGFGSAYLARQVGQKFAREIFFLGDEYSAEDAHRMGMVNAVVPHAELERVALEWGAKINGKSPTAQRMLKYSFNLIDDGLVGQQLFAGEATRLAYMTDEAAEGRDTFLEKRQPRLEPVPVALLTRARRAVPSRPSGRVRWTTQAHARTRTRRSSSSTTRRAQPRGRRRRLLVLLGCAGMAAVAIAAALPSDPPSQARAGEDETGARVRCGRTSSLPTRTTADPHREPTAESTSTAPEATTTTAPGAGHGRSDDILATPVCSSRGRTRHRHDRPGAHHHDRRAPPWVANLIVLSSVFPPMEDRP